MSEEATDEAHDDPGRDQPRADRGLRDLLHAAGRRAVGAAGRSSDADGDYYTLLGLPEEEGGYAGDPILGVRQADRPRAAAGRRASSTSACWRRRSCSSPPTRASSASRGSSTRWASTASCPTALRQLHPRFRTPWIGILVFVGPGDPDPAARPGGLPGQHLLVRGDAVVHDRPRRGDPAAPQAAGPPAPVPRPGQPADRRLRRAAVRDRGRHLHGDRVRRDRGAEPHRRRVRRRLAGARDPRLRRVPPPAGPRPALARTRSRSRSPSSTTRPSTTPSSCR